MSQNSVECFQRTLAAGPVVAGSNPCPPMSYATTNDVRTIPGPSPGGRFNSAYPLWDGTGRTLVSWEECRLLNPAGVIVPCTDANLAMPNVQIAPPLYSAWLLNPLGQHLQAGRTADRRRHGDRHRRAAGAHAARLHPADRHQHADGRCRRSHRHPQHLRLGRCHQSAGHRSRDQCPDDRTHEQYAGRFAAGTLHAPREDRVIGRQAAQRWLPGFQSANRPGQFTALHARDPRIRADRGRRLGARQGTRQCGLQHLDTRRQRAPAGRIPAASHLAAGAARRSGTVQRLPQRQHRHQHHLARSQRSIREPRMPAMPAARPWPR